MVGNLLWVSGNIGQDPATMKVSPDFGAAARQSLKNIEAILKAADLSLADVVKTNVYVTDVAKYEAFNAIYVEVMPKPLPARTFLGVAALPGGAQIEIEVVAAKK
jgi:2-iminobutanoate/2-iminopropanoate deaminase